MASCHAFVVLALCLSLALPASSTASDPATKLYSSGGTTVQNIFAAIVPAVNKMHKVAITYNPIGSDIGRQEFINGTSAFCETDVPMPSLEEATLHGAVKLTLPYLLQTISIFVYLPNNYQNVFLTSTVLAQIYQGDILYWADARIVKLNPTLKIASTQQVQIPPPTTFWLLSSSLCSLGHVSEIRNHECRPPLVWYGKSHDDE